MQRLGTHICLTWCAFSVYNLNESEFFYLFCPRLVWVEVKPPVRNLVKLPRDMTVTKLNNITLHLECWGGGTSCTGRTAPARSAPIGWWQPIAAPLLLRSQSEPNAGFPAKTVGVWWPLCCCAGSPSTCSPLGGLNILINCCWLIWNYSFLASH